MKKIFSILSVTALFLVAVVVLLANSKTTPSLEVIAPWAILLMIIAMGFYYAVFIFLRSAKKGEPLADELSKKILQKASSLSFYISIYMWLAVMYFSDRSELETHTQIGIGILGMSVIFAVCWMIFRFGGLKHV